MIKVCVRRPIHLIAYRIITWIKEVRVADMQAIVNILQCDIL